MTIDNTWPTEPSEKEKAFLGLMAKVGFSKDNAAKLNELNQHGKERLLTIFAGYGFYVPDILKGK